MRLLTVRLGRVNEAELTVSVAGIAVLIGGAMAVVLAPRTPAPESQNVRSSSFRKTRCISIVC